MSAKRIAFVVVAISAILLLVGLGPRIIAGDWSGAERDANTPPPEAEHNSVLILSPTSHGAQLLASIPQEAGMVDQYIEPAAIERVGPSSMLTFTAVSTAYLPLVVNGQGSAASPLPLGDITYWAYQIQDVSDPGAVDALAATHYDMLVLEPTRTDWSSDNKYFDTKGVVTQLKNSMASDGVHRKLVIAYIDIGEAEDWRWYWTWSLAWDCQPPTPPDWPDYIVACDPDGWTGNYPVAYWYDEWRDIVIYGEHTGTDPARDYNSIIDEVIKDGFDGIYLDWVEAFENDDIIDLALSEGVDPAQEMIWFIEDMMDYARLRNPNFVIIQQNAAALIDGHPELTDQIDAIAQEAIWYDGEATDDWNDPNGHDDLNSAWLTNYYIGYLDEYQDAGLPIFACEYALTYASTAYSNAYAEGYVPYVTRRSLSRLTTTPPPGY